MKETSMFRWADDKMCWLTQHGYDFVWDKFGITRGMLSTFCLCTATVYMYILEFSSSSPLISMVIITTCVNIFLITTEYRDHNLQLEQDYEILNEDALDSRANLLEMTCRLFLLFITVSGSTLTALGYIKSGKFELIVYSIALIAAIYLRTVLFRDREVQKESNLAEAGNV